MKERGRERKEQKGLMLQSVSFFYLLKKGEADSSKFRTGFHRLPERSHNRFANMPRLEQQPGLIATPPPAIRKGGKNDADLKCEQSPVRRPLGERLPRQGHVFSFSGGKVYEIVTCHPSQTARSGMIRIVSCP